MLIADLKEAVEEVKISKPGEDGRWSSCTAWSSRVPLDRISLESRLHLSWKFCAMRGSTRWHLSLAVRNNNITPSWATVRYNLIQANRWRVPHSNGQTSVVTPKAGQYKEDLLRALYPLWVQSSQKSSAYSIKTWSIIITDEANFA